jgi:hypothetical protein
VCGEIVAKEHQASIGGGLRGPVTVITPSLIQSSSLVFEESILNYAICIIFCLQKKCNISIDASIILGPMV